MTGLPRLGSVHAGMSLGSASGAGLPNSNRKGGKMKPVDWARNAVGWPLLVVAIVHIGYIALHCMARAEAREMREQRFKK